MDNLSLKMQISMVQDKNCHLNDMEHDFMYHLGLEKARASHFSCIKFVCIGGTNDRMTKFAHQIASDLGLDDVEHIGCHKRYVIFKVGEVLIASHGMGGSSISILLNELAKLLRYAQADSVWIRIGTCGGVGLEPGTVAISEQSLNGQLQPGLRSYVLGKEVFRPATFDPELCRQLLKVSEELGFPTVVGKTMTADDFYEGQGRLDGAICDYSEKDKMDFLQRAHEAGVRNIEMESLTFGAFTRHIGIRAATICAVLLNRLEGDQVLSTVEQLGQYEARATAAVLALVRNSLLRPTATADI